MLEARMLLRMLTGAALVMTLFSMGADAQNASAVIAAASKAMGVDTLNSITYSGTARNGAFGQSKSIGDPMGPVNLTQITQYTRTINFQPAGRARPRSSRERRDRRSRRPCRERPRRCRGCSTRTSRGAQAATNWGQALNVWTTPVGLPEGRRAPINATARQQGGQQVVSFSPPNFKSPSGQMYTVTGYINNQNLVTKVETRVEHAVVGDLLVEFEYSNYQNMNGVQVPAPHRPAAGGLTTFDADITSATANPPNLAELLTPPPAPARGGGGAAAAPPAAQSAGGRGAAAAPPAGAPPQAGAVQRARPAAAAGGGSAGREAGRGRLQDRRQLPSLAIDMGDHILVVESGQSDARGMAVMAAAKQAIPNKPIRFVVNSHPHFDHASGLAAAVAEGATILTHRNNEDVLERLLSGPRTLSGDSLSKVSNRRANVVEGVGDRDVRKGTNGKVVELHRIPNEHSDGMLAVYLPAEKVLWTADITVVNPNPGAARRRPRRRPRRSTG